MEDQRSVSRRDTLATRREHSKGDGNFPSPRPGADLSGETPEDRGIAVPEPPRPKRARPNARRSSAAKRAATPRGTKRGPRAGANVPQAPKSSEKSARKAALQRRAAVGKKRTGTAKAARPRTVRGSRAGRST